MGHVAIEHFGILFIQLLRLLVELAAVHVETINVAPVVRAFGGIEFVRFER
jgi:hypothetical protein